MNIIKKIIKVSCMVLMAVLLLCSCGPKNGFVEKKGVTYYYLNDEMQIGWQKINNEWYYFYETDYYEGEYKGKGSMKRGTWLKKDGDYYFFDLDGKMLRNVLRELDDGKMYYFDSNGKMLHDTKKTVGEKVYRIDSNGVAHKQPDYMLTFNCTFPQAFSCSSGEVIIDNISYICNNNANGKWFELFWSGTDGYHSKYYLNESTRKYVGFKLYDPDGYVIDTGTLMTEALFVGDKFRDEKRIIGGHKLNKKGIYKLELLNSTR